MKRFHITQLFRYYGNDEWASQVIKQNTIFCPKASRFNDPFDCKIPIKVELEASSYIAAKFNDGKKKGYSWDTIKSNLDKELEANGDLSESVKQRIINAAKENQDYIETCGVLCLTEDRLSVLMWSHYANNHKGLCLGFERTENNALGDDDACKPITYSDVYPLPSFSQIYTPDGSLSKATLYTKAREWEYEKEWRLTIANGDVQARLPGTLKTVILGCRYPKEQIESMAVLCKEKGVVLEQARMIPGQFALEAVRVQ